MLNAASFDLDRMQNIENGPPPLPDGKDYHVFFSYRNTDEDTEWTRNVIRELETRGFKCCDHELEFLPGKGTVENIKDYMRRSVKIVHVLSKEYTDSYYCKLEVHFSLYMSLSERKHILIPVKREDCNIPEDFEFFTWIDARDDAMHWFPQLLAAIKAPVNAGFTQPFLQVHKYENFDTIFQETSTNSCCGEAFQTRYIPDYLRRSGIDFNPEVFTKLIAEMTPNRLIKQRMFINPWWPTCFILYFVLPEFLIGGFGMTLADPEDKQMVLIGILCLVLFAIFGIAWPCYCIFASWKGRSEMKSSLDEINKALMFYNIFMTYNVSRMSAKVTIYFIYYDIGPCLQYMKIRQSRRNSETREKVEYVEEELEDEEAPLIGPDKTNTQDEDLNTLLKVSAAYFENFLSGKFNQLSATRHTSRAICLCQFLEQVKESYKIQDEHDNIIEV